MMRLIDADELLKPVGSYNPIKYTYEYGEVVTVEDIKQMPTVDTERHGQWIEVSPQESYKCSVCSLITDWEDIYCPNCGAKMDEAKE